MKLPEDVLDCSYHGERGSDSSHIPETDGCYRELSTWKLMVERGEMSKEALSTISTMSFSLRCIDSYLLL